LREVTTGDTHESVQEETIEIEYFEATVPPQKAATLPHDDWVSGIDCRSPECVFAYRWRAQAELFADAL